ncbi:ELL-associated factor 1-like isoform X1 [Palaemon carinicauda]|uniref:ELL-associated factor 1-like isoform X1 n=2 Tax=Palaemon carinicauda TaxID=392227 RepID=UPI0035B58FB0
MAFARLGLDGNVKNLRLGETFNKGNREVAYHTIRYDFKPASMDKQKMGTVLVEGNHQVTVTVPHVEGAGTSQTVFKGNHKPVARECVLIIDHNTGEIVLERISQAVSVKTTRPEVSSRMTTQRPTTPLDPMPRKSSPSCGSSMSHSRPSPSHSKNLPSKSSPHARSPPNTNSHTPGSMPLLGFDDNAPNTKGEGFMSESSSDSESNSSSSSSSDSDSDSDGEQEPAPKKANGHGNSTANAVTNGSNNIYDDLNLSSGSDSE